MTRISLIAIALLLGIGSPSAHATEVKEWSFLIFLNGNNNLDPYGDMDLKEMEKVGSTKDINIVVQWASLSSGTTRRLLVQKSTNPDAVTSPIVEDIGKVDMGDWKNLVSFVEWSVKNYPAKKYFLNVWNHGSGWHNLMIDGTRLSRRSGSGFGINDISYDDNTGNAITTQQLGQALKEIAVITGKKIDLFGSDACLMAMAEVATEVKDSVDVYAGSQDLEPAEGWPYDKFLALLARKPKMEGAELGKILAKEYLKSYSNGSQGNKEVTFSIVDLRHFDGLLKAMKEFGAELQSKAPQVKTQVLAAANEAQSFTYTDYKDLLHFLELLESKSPDAVSKATRDNLKNAYKKTLVANETTRAWRNAKGLSFWMPTDQGTYDYYRSTYDQLEIQNQTNWSSALQELLR